MFDIDIVLQIQNTEIQYFDQYLIDLVYLK
jgi:hypothetical protein